ncbi:hypothetical protein [Brevundimonas sp. TWP1-2-1b1]|uniref:hypothetical protein n=1 Tax=unclassified Brevundimonas TaxID=2622653 RepID=UPI003CF9E39D
MDDTSERLVRVETKLDSLITLNDQRITAAERRIDEVRTEAANRTRHEKANYDQKLMAIEKKIEAKADQKEVSFMGKVVFGACGVVLIAVLSALIAIVVIKPNIHVERDRAPVVQQIAPR